MTVATSTPNLNMIKPAGTDYVLVSDINTNTDILDTSIGKLSELNTSAKTNLVAAINEANSSGANAPYIGENGNWYQWDAATSQYVDSDTAAQGDAAGFGAPTATASELTAGATPTVSITASGENTAKVFGFEFGIPAGATGTAATIAVGTVTTGEPGTAAAVTNSGTAAAAVLDFTIPKGENGATGAQGYRVDNVYKKSGTGAAGTTDVYSMKLNDPDETEVGTFDVYNGADGQGAGDMTKAVYDTANNGYVDKAAKLNTARAITLSGDAAGTANFDGSADVSITTTLAGKAVTNAKLADMAANTIKGAADAGTPADLTAAQARGVLNVSDGADKTGTVLEATSAIDAIADGDKIILEDVSADAGSQTKHVLWSAIKTVLGSLFVPQTRAVNSKALSADIVLAASDIGAQAKITASGLIKGDGEGGVTAAVAGTDYASPAADITTTLAAADWVGDSAPYYQDVAASGVSSTSKLDVGCAAGLTATQYAAAVSAQLAAYSAGTDSVRIYAYGAKPTVAIPILIRVVG